MRSIGIPRNGDASMTLGTRKSHAVVERYDRLDAGQRRAAVLWLCWRAVWRWEERVSTDDQAAESIRAVRAAREALVVLGSGKQCPADKVAALLSQLGSPSLDSAGAAPCHEPVAAAIRALLSAPPNADAAQATLQQALAAFGEDALPELSVALAQQCPAGRPRQRALGHVLADVVLGLLHLVAVAAVPISAPIGTRRDLVVLGMVLAIVLPATVTATRKHVDRWRFAAFLISGAVSTWLYFTDSGLAFLFGDCCS